MSALIYSGPIICAVAELRHLNDQIRDAAVQGCLTDGTLLQTFFERHVALGDIEEYVLVICQCYQTRQDDQHCLLGSRRRFIRRQHNISHSLSVRYCCLLSRVCSRRAKEEKENSLQASMVHAPVDDRLL